MPRCLGDPIPAGEVHGVSVQLPLWTDNIGWAGREPQALARMKTGYPRFFIHRLIDTLAQELIAYLRDHDVSSTLSTLCTQDPLKTTPKDPPKELLALLFPCPQSAFLCRGFLERAAAAEAEGAEVRVRALDLGGPIRDPIEFPLQELGPTIGHDGKSQQPPSVVIDWHKCPIFVVTYPPPLYPKAKAFWQHTGYGISSRQAAYFFQNQTFLSTNLPAEATSEKIEVLVDQTTASKKVIRQRLAELASSEQLTVTEDDVFLYPTGMTGISQVAAALTRSRRHINRPITVAIFGFLYVDTFKVLSTVYDFQTHLFGHASTSDIDTLRTGLANSTLQIDALFTEFPGNPLLISPDLLALHQLSRQHNFWLVVDDTIGTSVNLSLLPHCDILCTSLTKMFSGACNVMGGSVTLNPSSPVHSSIAFPLAAEHTDSYFPPEATLMATNSFDFRARVQRASANAARVAAQLRAHPAVSAVYYPEHSPSQGLYDSMRRPGGGYGFLLSVTFVTPACATAFHDELDVDKGPSLGTNFSLACAYTLLAHFREMDWAAKYGVVEYLVRLSVGLEEVWWLEAVIGKALEAAEHVRGSQGGGRVSGGKWAGDLVSK